LGTAALALVVVTVTVPTFVFETSDERATPDEKADAQYDKGHADQANKACDKGGYDGYVGGDCGYLDQTKVGAAPFIKLIIAIR
jgi:hypothetical protein